MNKAVFLDRDGTVVVDRGYLADPAGLELLPGVPEALVALRKAGFKLVLVTNQSGIGRGHFSRAAVDQQHRRLAQLLAPHGIGFDGVFVCPHRPDEGCTCRKPSPEMLRAAAADLGLELKASFMVGDKGSDVVAGRAAGCRTVRVASDGDDPVADATQPDLRAAGQWIVAQATNASNP